MTTIKILKLYFKSHKLRLFILCLSIIIVTLASIAPAYVLRYIIDTILPSQDHLKLLEFSLLYVGLYVWIGVSGFLNDFLMLHTASDITSFLRLEMMKKVHHMSYRTIVEEGSGSLEAYFTNDVNQINELFTSGVIHMITDAFKIIAILISTFIFSTMFGCIALGAFPLIFLFTLFVRKGMQKAQIQAKSIEGNVNKALLENVENMEQIQVHHAKPYVIKAYDSILRNHFKVKQVSNFYDAIFSPMMQIFRNALICVLLLLSGYNGDFFHMTVGAVIAGITLLTDLFSPIESLGMEIQTIQKSLAAVKRMDSFFQMEEERCLPMDQISSYDIKLQNVDFAYMDGKSVLSDFSMSIPFGEKIVFKGPSGSGKSTIMKLALGLISPNHGKVQIGDVDTKSLSDKAREELFAIVYQDPFFSGGTFYEEISLLDERVTKEQVHDALALVGMEYVKNIDEPLNPKQYSSGELQLLNIARIIVKNPKIIFLDEMNSTIDLVTSKKIMELMNQIAKDKTVISISHYGQILDGARVIELK